MGAARRADPDRPGGIGSSSSVLYDERGPIGFAQQTLFVAAR